MAINGMGVKDFSSSSVTSIPSADFFSINHSGYCFLKVRSKSYAILRLEHTIIAFCILPGSLSHAAV